MRKGRIYFVGIGLTPKHITLQALEAIKRVNEVYMDSYTSLLVDDGNELAKVLGREVRYLRRTDIEDKSLRDIIKKVDEGLDIAILVVGDPHIATTHVALINELRMRGYDVEVIPGISIFCAVMTYTGLCSYRFGKPATVVFPKGGVEYDYPYYVIKDNKERGLHTFLLLELDVEKGVFMKINNAVDILLRFEERYREGVLSPDEEAVGIARLGGKDQLICVDRLSRLREIDFGGPPHSLIILAPKLHFVEEESLKVLKSEFRERCSKAP